MYIHIINRLCKANLHDASGQIEAEHFFAQIIIVNTKHSRHICVKNFLNSQYCKRNCIFYFNRLHWRLSEKMRQTLFFIKLCRQLYSCRILKSTFFAIKCNFCPIFENIFFRPQQFASSRCHFTAIMCHFVRYLEELNLIFEI